MRKCCTLEPNLYRLSFSFFIRFFIFGCKSNIVHHICQHSISVEILNSVNALEALLFVFLSFGLIHLVLRCVVAFFELDLLCDDKKRQNRSIVNINTYLCLNFGLIIEYCERPDTLYYKCRRAAHGLVRAASDGHPQRHARLFLRWQPPSDGG